MSFFLFYIQGFFVLNSCICVHLLSDPTEFFDLGICVVRDSIGWYLANIDRKEFESIKSSYRF